MENSCTLQLLLDIKPDFLSLDFRAVDSLRLSAPKNKAMLNIQRAI